MPDYTDQMEFLQLSELMTYGEMLILPKALILSVQHMR